MSTTERKRTARVTLHDVAAHAGVSAITVSRVCNGSAPVSVDKRERVQASIDCLGYVPNRLARGLIRGKTSAIAILVPDVANPFFASILDGVEETAWRAGYHVMLCVTRGDLQRECRYLEDMLSFQVEGVLIVPVSDRSGTQLRLLTRNNVPFVLIDVAVVCFDDVEYSRLYPFLTVMSQPAERYGAIATQLLLDRLNGST